MEAMTQATDGELTGVIASAASGDDVAFGWIVGAHHDDMRRVCVFITRQDALADDAMQAAWTIVWRKLGSLREPDRLRYWLVSIAANEAKKLVKKRGRRSELEVATDATEKPGGVDPATGVDAIDLRAALLRLDLPSRCPKTWTCCPTRMRWRRVSVVRWQRRPTLAGPLPLSRESR
jgi:RNA polymerase sigma-70 factor (ECF subfamily)